MTIDVYIAYAHQDASWMERLRKQLSAAERIGLVDAWHDGEIEIGTDKMEAARQAMEAAEIIVLLLSADFFASKYLYEQELGQALILAESKDVKLIPVLVRDCTWQLTPLAQYQILPKNGKPITDKSWQNPDQALKGVADEIIRMSTAIRSGEQSPTVYHPVSEQVTTSEKKNQKSAEEKNEDQKSNTPLWRLALYALAGLGGFALVSFLIDQAFSNPDPGPNMNTELNETPENNNTSEVLTPTETGSRGTAPFTTLQLGNREWAATNISIAVEGAISPAENERSKNYGLLYPLEAARKVCPEGWRLPTREDWQSLNSKQVAQLRLTKAGFYHKAYMQTGNVGYYLTSENTAGDQVWVAEFRGDDRTLKMDRRYAHWAMSCRCVR